MFAAVVARATRSGPAQWAAADTLLGALFPFARPDRTGVWQDGRALLVQGLIHNTPESLREQVPETCRETGRVIVSWVRLDNREALCASLGLSCRGDLTDPQIILAAHRRWGEDCASHLDGDFSFVIHDPASGRTYCARDAMGARPLYYFLDDAFLVAATSIAAIRSISSLRLTPCLEWAALFAAGMGFAHDQGAYEQVRKLPPAHDMALDSGSSTGPREYFTFDVAAPHSARRDERWVEDYRAAFDRAVRVRARSEFLMGADSSGGLDSASVVATLTPLLPHDPADFHVFAMIAMEQEPELVDAVSAMCGVANTHRLTGIEMLRIDDSFERALAVLGHPPEHGQLLLHPEFFALFQALGVRTILSGYGGDEVVTNQARHLVDELHHRGDYAAVFAELSGAFPTRAARWARRMMQGPTDPDIRARGLMETKLAIAGLSREFVEDTGLGERIEQWFLPKRDAVTLNAIAANDPGFRFGRAGRLESSAIYASTFGTEYRFPMYDRQLVQQYFATPSIEKRRGGMGRYLHRRAMDGRIPPRIQWQKSKYVGDFIGGRPALDTASPKAFDDLPEGLRRVLDRVAFEQTMVRLQQEADDFSADAMRRRYFFWQVRQLCVWLEGP